jgi:hypothetical protein
MSLWKNGRCQINIRNNRFQIKSKVIGNDIVDLAWKESNWKRPGYLNKIFTTKEQLLISSAENPNTMVWNGVGKRRPIKFIIEQREYEDTFL